MSSVIDEIRQEGREEAREEFAVRLLKMGKLSMEEISHAASLPLEAIQRLANANQQYA